jgi:hypothetical protein
MRVFPFLLLAVACGRRAGTYPVPEQRPLDLGADPGGIEAFIEMADPAANDYIVRDISPEPGVYRWAFLHPELRFRVRRPEDLFFTAELALPEVTFRVTGPVTVTYALDGKVLGSVRCDHVGRFQVRKAVPAGWVQLNQYVHVTFAADRRWVSPDDGAQLSFLLFNAGFTP